MKLGCCLNMNATDNAKIGTESIPVFSSLGYDYLELPLAQVMDLSEDEFAGLLARINAGGIPVEACNNFFPASVRLTGGDARLETALEYAKRACGRAAEMGVEIIVLGSSGAKNIPEGFSRDRARGQFIELLYRLQEIVRPLGITIVLEPLNTKESNFIITAGEALEIVREAAQDNIKLLVDYYHMRMEDEDAVVVLEAGTDLRHLHLASKNGRLFPDKKDGEDYAGFFRILESAGYDRRVSVEAYSKDIVADAAKTASLLRLLMCSSPAAL